MARIFSDAEVMQFGGPWLAELVKEGFALISEKKIWRFVAAAPAAVLMEFIQHAEQGERVLSEQRER